MKWSHDFIIGYEGILDAKIIILSKGGHDFVNGSRESAKCELTVPRDIHTHNIIQHPKKVYS